MKIITISMLILLLLLPACSSPDSTPVGAAIKPKTPVPEPTQAATLPVGTTAAVSPSPTATTVLTATPTPASTGTPAPSSTPIPTPLVDEVPRGVQDVYRILVEIEFNIHALEQTAENVESGDVPQIELVSAILAVSSLIGDVDDEISATRTPPEWLSQDWQQALDIHESTRKIVEDWTQGQIDYAQVREQTQPLMEQADTLASGVEEKIAARYPVELSVLRQFRQRVLMQVGELFLTPTPTASQ
jgi:hypothetical protein